MFVKQRLSVNIQATLRVKKKCISENHKFNFHSNVFTNLEFITTFKLHIIFKNVIIMTIYKHCNNNFQKILTIILPSMRFYFFSNSSFVIYFQGHL